MSGAAASAETGPLFLTVRNPFIGERSKGGSDSGSKD
jgi:Asp-tRNA(Asn)/Glu-tRNA(Gln) amidotransferase A subunit family amidase